MYVAAVWAAVAPRRFLGLGMRASWGWGRNVRCLLVSFVVAAILWILLGGAFDLLLSLPQEFPTNLTAVGSALEKVWAERLDSAPWLILLLTTTASTALLVWIPLPKLESERPRINLSEGTDTSIRGHTGRRIRDAIIQAAALGVAAWMTHRVFLMFDASYVSHAPLIIGLAMAIGFCIGAVVPEWQRLSESGEVPP